MISDKMLMTLFDKLNNGNLSNLEDISSSSENTASDLSSILTVLGGLGDTASNAGSLYAILKYIAVKYTVPAAVIAAPQTLTASFVDVGGENLCIGKKYAGIWIKITANAATNIQLQILAKNTAAASLECNLPIMTVSTSVVSIIPEIVEFPASNGSYLLAVELNNIIPYIQIQAKDTTGSTHATIDICEITLG